MKTTLRKIARLVFVLLIPATILIGCQEDLNDPILGDGRPDGDVIVTPPKKK